MKRFLLSSICSFALLLFAGNTQLVAQQEAPAKENGNVVVIQKIKHDDGTVTIKKKSIEKGQEVQTYLDELNLQGASGKSEIVIMTDGESDHVNFDGETIMYLRKGKSSNGGKDDVLKELDEIRITMPQQDFMHHSKRVEKKTFLGVYPQTGDEGVLITGVVGGSGADDAGLQANDVLTAINGNTIRSNGDLSSELAKYEPGNEVKITYLRDGSILETNAKLTANKSNSNNYSFTWKEERDPCKVFFGVYVGSYGEGLEGVGVSGIVEGDEWPAEKAGLQRGDRIIAIDAIPVNNHRELVTERDKHKSGQAFTFTILRDGYPMDIDAQFKECPNQPAVEKVTGEVIPEMQPVELIDNTLELEELNAYPNPTFGLLNVKFSGEAVPTKLMITDVNGKVVHQENLPNFDGYYNRELDISSGTPGTLMLSIRQGEKVVTTPLVLLNRA